MSKPIIMIRADIEELCMDVRDLQSDNDLWSYTTEELIEKYLNQDMLDNDFQRIEKNDIGRTIRYYIINLLHDYGYQYRDIDHVRVLRDTQLMDIFFSKEAVYGKLPS